MKRPSRVTVLGNLDVIDKSVHTQRFPEEQTRRQVNGIQDIIRPGQNPLSDR